jgi:hypothetical protein
VAIDWRGLHLDGPGGPSVPELRLPDGELLVMWAHDLLFGLAR